MLQRARTLIGYKMAVLFTEDELKDLRDDQQVFAFANINSELRVRARGAVHKFESDEDFNKIYEDTFREAVPT